MPSATIDSYEAAQPTRPTISRNPGETTWSPEAAERRCNFWKGTRSTSVVTDMRMSDFDGPALYREAVAIDPLLESSFVFVIGDIFSAETQAFLSHTGAVRLAKPCTFEDIEDAVCQVVRERPQGPIVE
jgi:FixJ family two-component response regulator